MANSYKNIVITPNRSSNTADPKIEFLGANSTVNTAITIQAYPTSSGTLSFEGTAGQLFSVTNDMSGSIYSVNDVSGIPSIEVFANGQVTLAQYGGKVCAGTGAPFDNVSFTTAQFQGGLATKIPGTALTTQISFFNNNGRVGYIGTDGTTTSYNTGSDARLKHDIVDAPEASNLVDAIKIRSFKWNVDNSEQRYGMIAQELATVAPEAVHQPANPDEMMGLDYSKLVPMLIKEVQSLRARVAQLEGN
jgi:hypothetical protein